MTALRYLLLLSILAGPGCLKMPTLVWDAKPPAKKEVGPAPQTPPVKPEDVTETNSREKLDALQAELDYAANEKQPGMSRLSPSNVEK
jgi:hypothetical protein